MAESRAVQEAKQYQKIKQEAHQYLQELTAYVAPGDKLTTEDLLAGIAIEEVMEHCEKSRLGGQQRICQKSELSRFRANPKSFTDDFLRSKRVEHHSIYQKMAQRTLDAAKLYLQAIPNQNRYLDKALEIHENFQRCFSIVSAWDYLKLPAGDFPVFFEMTGCGEQVKASLDVKVKQRSDCFMDNQPNGRSRYVCGGGYSPEW